MEELRSIILDLQTQLNSIINRIPDMRKPEASSSSNRSLSFSSRSPVETRSSESELPGEGPNGCPEQYHSPVLVAFHKWARILLSLFIDKVGLSIVYLRLLTREGILRCLPAFPEECKESHLASRKAEVRVGARNHMRC